VRPLYFIFFFNRPHDGGTRRDRPLETARSDASYRDRTGGGTHLHKATRVNVVCAAVVFPQVENSNWFEHLEQHRFGFNDEFTASHSRHAPHTPTMGVGSRVRADLCMSATAAGSESD
jgi:hypothetical protein